MTDVAPELIVHNARIYTVDPAQPWVEALAVRGGIIAATGDSSDLLDLAGPDTTLVDLGGRMMMPGIVDVHTHLLLGGQADYWEIAISPTSSLEEIIEIVRTEAARLEPGEWVIGGLVGSPALAQVTSETLAALDEASAGHPVLLRDDTQHNRWVNSATLALMGVDESSHDPEGGTWVKDDDGRLTGVVWELGSELVEATALASMVNVKERHARSAERAIEILNSCGITATQEAATMDYSLEALADLDRSAGLNAWVVGSMPAGRTVVVGEYGSPLYDRGEQYRTAHVLPDFTKVMADGIPMSYTATMLEPYAPAHHDHGHGFGQDFRGPVYYTMPQLLRILDECHQRGLGCKLHATGDGTVRQVLDAVEILRDMRGPGPIIQIAHVEFVSEADVARFVELGVVPDVSPAMWYPSPMSHAIDAVLSGDVMKRMWPFRELVEAGTLMSAGSDWPCAMGSPEPWTGLEAMITRANPDPAFPGVLNPDQAIGVEDAIRAFTISPATAIGLGDRVGSLSTGKSADFIVLNHNLLEVAAEAIHATVVEQTWFEGRKVYEASVPAGATA